MHHKTHRKGRGVLVASFCTAGLLAFAAQNLAAQEPAVGQTVSDQSSADAKLDALKKRAEERGAAADAAGKDAKEPVTIADASPAPTPDADAQAAPPATPPAATPAAPAAPAVDNDTPFAFADFTWMLSNPRNHDEVLDGKYYSGEFRIDTNYMYDLNHPIDHTLGGTTEGERTGEFVIQAVNVGGDFHAGNMQGRILTQFGAVSTAVPRNDASYSLGQWQLTMLIGT